MNQVDQGHGSHETNLRRYAADGIQPAGRLSAADGDLIRFAGELEQAGAVPRDALWRATGAPVRLPTRC